LFISVLLFEIQLSMTEGWDSMKWFKVTVSTILSDFFKSEFFSQT
jgi:hypothetical protein